MSLSLSRGKWSQEAGGREQGERGGDRETHFRVCEGSHCCGWTPQNIQGAHRMPPDLLSQAGEVNLPPCWATGPPGPFCFWLRVTLCVCEWAWVCVLSCVWPSGVGCCFLSQWGFLMGFKLPCISKARPAGWEWPGGLLNSKPLSQRGNPTEPATTAPAPAASGPRAAAGTRPWEPV